ncbi:glycosyltransferase family 2 protein [Streptomyces sp. MUM 178J]|uniref:glycosyltransferase family 2 protein n=1 Tax=Streptomyces sp. MUM 178J TaxID=2791991 RepID=UPI001F03A892|nr:glycosyltransferase family 2 protein [Streptomyces sp. MUM 178J]WRQ79861.1 glycosyltransferase family 2 protein [Streptomyces sp. MUM 178J]
MPLRGLHAPFEERRRLRPAGRPAPGGPGADRARAAYRRCAWAAGPLEAVHTGPVRVRFRSVPTAAQRLVLTVLASLTALSGLALAAWLLLPQHIPGPGVTGVTAAGDWRVVLARFAFCVVVTIEIIKVVQVFAVWTFAWHAEDPVPLTPPRGLRIAMLTTIVPSKEPLDVAEQTLEAMLRVTYYAGDVDVWILDEGDDPAVRAMAARLGVRHFSRKNRPEYHRPWGIFRTRTKSGNHNAWRAEHERRYDVVAQMDPDHVPLPCFLERTLGYFHDPDVAFVVAPQVYGNMYDNWIAHGASVQQYLFSGIVERGGNGLGAPLLIGTNHLYRTAAWRSIGGYQDSIIEDHLTSMRIQGTVNQRTGNRWKGVYTPDVIAVGEGPTTWTDYFNQQKRWAYGVWEIKLNRRLTDGIRLSRRQRLLYTLVQFYYPSVALTLLLGTAATVLALLLGVMSAGLDGTTWLGLWSAGMGSWLVLWLWLRRFNLAGHERSDPGLTGFALALFAGPVYAAAAVSALLRRPLGYAVTAKGELRSADTPRTFRLHLIWAAAVAAPLAASYALGHDHPAPRFWAVLALLAGLLPPLMAAATAGVTAGAAASVSGDAAVRASSGRPRADVR